MKRIVAFDQGLGPWTGHWVNFHSALRDEALSRGIEYLAFGSRQIDPAIIGDLPVRPCFTDLPWTDLSGDAESDFRRGNEIAARDLAGLGERFGSGDLLLFPTVTAQQVGAFIKFGAGMSGARSALLTQGKDAVDLFGVSHEIPLFRRAADTPGFADFLLFASSEDLAAVWSLVWRRPVEPLCMPISAQSSLAEREPGPLRIGYFGHSSAAKGGLLLDDIVQRGLAGHAVEFILHVNPNWETDKALAAFDAERPSMTILRGHISPEQYQSALRRCDIVLMPYDRAKYAEVPSSVFSEALIAGKVVVGPERTWISREARKAGAAVCYFDEFGVAPIVDALGQAIERFPELQQQAIRARERWLAANSVARFMDKMLEAAERPRQTDYGWRT